MSTRSASAGTSRPLAPALETLEPRLLLAADLQVFAPGNVEIVEGDNYDFGTAPQGSTFEKVFRLRNAGDAALSVSGWDDLGAPIVEQPLNIVLQPGQSITLTLQMQTLASGPAGGVMQIYSNDPDEATFDFTVSGTITPAPALTVLGHPQSISFGSVLQGSTASHPLGLLNSGDLPLSITGYELTGGFWLSHNLPDSLASGQRFDLAIRMPTHSVGPCTGVLTLFTNDPDEPQLTLPVAGSVRAPVAQITLSPTQHSSTQFGRPRLGSVPVTRDFTISNTGDGDLVVDAITLPNGFVLATPLTSQTIAPGQSRGFRVTLSTAAVGEFAGDIVVTSNAPAGPATLAITGRVVFLTEDLTGTSDFDGDGRNDLVAQNGILLQAARYDGTYLRLPRVYAAGWKLVGVGDLDGDADPDLLLRQETTGRNAVWRMDGTDLEGVTRLPWAPLPWRVVGIGDFTGDGVGDIAWRHTDGRNVVWAIQDAARSAVLDLPSADERWQAGGGADFDGDGQADLLFRDRDMARCGVWLLDGTTRRSSAILTGRYDPIWRISDVRDFDGDGYGDLLWRRPEVSWRGLRMDGELWHLWDGEIVASRRGWTAFRDLRWATGAEASADLIEALPAVAGGEALA